jgi:hypothetical protein
VTCSDTGAAPWSWELTAGENPGYPQQPEDCYFIAGTEGSLAVPSLRLGEAPLSSSHRGVLGSRHFEYFLLLL